MPYAWCNLWYIIYSIYPKTFYHITYERCILHIVQCTYVIVYSIQCTLQYTMYICTIYSRVLQMPHDFLNFRIKACHFTQLRQMMPIAKLQILVTIGLHLD